MEQTELQPFNLAEKTARVKILTAQAAENIVEIGKTLNEVKEHLPYGEFQNWLENEVNYSSRTAYNFMKVAKEFPDVQPVAKLGMRKLLALAGMEAEERKKVINNNDLETMTAKEVEKVIEEEKRIKCVLDIMDKLSRKLPYRELIFDNVDFSENGTKALTVEEIEQEKRELEDFIYEEMDKERLYWYEPLKELREVINNDKDFANATIGLDVYTKMYYRGLLMFMYYVYEGTDKGAEQ